MRLARKLSQLLARTLSFRVFAVGLCLIYAGYAASLELVIKEGDAAPGTGGTFNLPFNVNGFQPVLLDNCGITYFFAASELAPAAPRNGIWASNGTTTVDLAINGQILPQFEPSFEDCVGAGPLCGEIFNTQALFHVTGLGNVLLRTTREDNIGSVAFFEGTSNADLSPILVSTDIPGFPFNAMAIETGSGNYLAGPYIGNAPFGAVVGGLSDFVTPMIGVQAPDIADPVTVTEVVDTSFSSNFGFNENADLLFVSRLSDSSEALYLDPFGEAAPILLARTGSAVTGIADSVHSGLIFNFSGEAELNNNGKGYYFSQWISAVLPPGNDNLPREGIWRFDSSGQSELVVARYRDPARDIAFSTSEFSSTVFSNIILGKIAPNGDVWFNATGRERDVNGIPDSSDERVGLWRSPVGGGQLELVLRVTTSDAPGSPFPDGPNVPGTLLPGGDNFEGLGYSFYGFDEHSHLVFTTFGGIYIDGANGMELIVGKGDAIEVGPSDTRIVDLFTFNNGSIPGDVAAAFRNDRLAFSVKFTDGSTAIFRTAEVNSCELPYRVNSTADGIDQIKGDGFCNTGNLIGGQAECTLRAAIEEANARVGKQIVNFDIPADQATAGIFEIQVSSSFPLIIDPIVIDATSQMGYQPGAPAVELNAIPMGMNPSWGFQIVSGNSEVRGFSLYKFSKNAIVLQSNGGNRVRSNIIGSNAQNDPAIGNGEDGILIFNSANNIIGGTTVAERNIISRNGQAGTGGYGVRIEGMGSTGNEVIGNYIGTNVEGSQSLGNGQGGVLITDAPENSIGTSEPDTGNLISGNTGHGIRIQNPQAQGNVISGNVIGLDLSTTQVLGNTRHGVLISNGAGSGNIIGGLTAVPGLDAGNMIAGNLMNGIRLRAMGQSVLGNTIGTNILDFPGLGNGENGVSIDADDNAVGNGNTNGINIISGNMQSGILVSGPGKNNYIDGNYIGTDATGLLGRANNIGITVRQSASNKLFRNIISANTSHGILVAGSDATANQIEANYIGTDVDGFNALGNGEDGILLRGALNTLIRYNVIADNGVGAVIGGGVSILGKDEGGVTDAKQANANNQVIANYIGTDVLGNPLGNAFDGVLVQNSSRNIIGPDNLIRDNGFVGVLIFKDSYGDGNLISANRIFDNGFIGIDLGFDGVTANDPLDIDGGANELQNFPVINTIIGNPINLVQGVISSKPNTAYTIEVFSNSVADASNHGEGELFEGAFPVVTNGSGDGAFLGGFGKSQAGDCISVTARENASNDTSEFSICETISDPVFDSLDYGDAPDADGLYPTLAINNGARHRIAGGVYLGSGVDADINGQPNIDATGDDNDGMDDEQGITFIEDININSPQPQVEVVASTAGKLDAWIDFNADGDWNDASDHIFSSVPLVAGLNSLGFVVPANTDPGLTFARFRFSSDGNLTPIGPALDGEVEDHQVEITPLPQQLNFFDEDLTGTRSYETCTTITLQLVVIKSGANITLIAPSVEFLNGFRVENGATLRVIIATPTQCV